MRIVIDLTPISYHLTGMERYAMCIVDRMISLDRDHTYILLFRNEVHPLFADRVDGKWIQAKVLRGDRKLFFLQFTLTRALYATKADKYLFLAFPSPILFRRKGIINTIHDMGAWDASSSMQTLSMRYFRLSYRNAKVVSERILTVSNFSKGRIESILKYPPDKIEVVNPAAYTGMTRGKEISYEQIKGKYSLPDRYILTLSTLEPRKNLGLLLEAYDRVAEQVDYDLVLVGRKGWKINDVLQSCSASQRIHLTGFVEDEHLSAIYRHALCFVFPSLYEGFGLPPVEALALGTPVISSDAASLPEVLMDRATYFASNSEQELESALLNLEDNLDKMPRSLNDKQKKNYDFSTSAGKILDILSR